MVGRGYTFGYKGHSLELGPKLAQLPEDAAIMVGLFRQSVDRHISESEEGNLPKRRIKIGKRGIEDYTLRAYPDFTMPVPEEKRLVAGIMVDNVLPRLREEATQEDNLFYYLTKMTDREFDLYRDLIGLTICLDLVKWNLDHDYLAAEKRPMQAQMASDLSMLIKIVERELGPRILAY